MNDKFEKYFNEMDDYINWLKKLSEENPEEAKKIARQDLIRTGIIDDKGNLKYPYNGELSNGEFTRGPKWNCGISDFQTSNQDKIQKVSVRQIKLK